MTYEEFIDVCKLKKVQKPFHKHHIIPLSINGPDTKENIVHLNFEDHWEAHRLLAEENPDNEVLVKDFKKLGTLEQFVNRSRNCFEAASNPSEEVRAKLSTNKGKHFVFSDEHKKHIAEAMIGKTMPEETKKKISDSLKGRPSPNKGRQWDDEYKKRMSESIKGRRWFNNGQIETYTYECPEGFIQGRLKSER